MSQDTCEPSTSLEADIAHSKSIHAGGPHRRAYVGPAKEYDFMGATQFRLLTSLGLREEHYMLDIGCGSLRAGKYLLQYLMPGRYVGLEPNSWLWQDALQQEIGEDTLRIKRPLFLDNDDFSLTGDTTPPKDFVVAQSIYTHTGHDLFTRSVKVVADNLAPGGQFLFNATIPGDLNYSGSEPGREKPGWNYPECVSFDADTVTEICQQAGLFVQRLDWFHPRVSWFRAVHNPKFLLTDAMLAQLGTGRPLFDRRFK